MPAYSSRVFPRSIRRFHRHTQRPPGPCHGVISHRQHNRGLGVSAGSSTDWNRLFRKGHNVNVLSAARFFLFGSRDVWFEIGLPLFLRVELGWKRELVGLILAGIDCTDMSSRRCVRSVRSGISVGRRICTFPGSSRLLLFAPLSCEPCLCFCKIGRVDLNDSVALYV